MIDCDPPPEVAAKLIHEILSRLAPVGRMIMVRTIIAEYRGSYPELAGFSQGLECGDAMGLFYQKGEALLRKQ